MQERACSHDRWRGTLDVMGEDVQRVSDVDLWRMRSDNRRALVDYVRERAPRELTASGVDEERVARARGWLAPEALTLGFARRFATYKRPTLMLQSPDRLVRILTDPERPVQLVIAGKAHPADAAGRAMIAEWVRFSRTPDLEGRVVFVPDYDLLLAEHLVQSVDLWINTPRRPWEASGTSGMKVLVNGGLNLSELDGWWAEAYSPGVGWALGDGREHGDDPFWDAAEADALYDLLEREIVPAFYDRDERGIPAAWVDRMRASMATLTPRFSTNRVVREYTEHYYLPAAAAYRRRTATGAELAERLLGWRRHLVEHWAAVRFGPLRVETRDGEHHVAVEVHLGQLGADAVRVELFAEPGDAGEPVRREMSRGDAPAATPGGEVFVASVPASRPIGDFTPRVVPYHPDASTPLEVPLIAWQR
ncbi:MAG TPA: alpha-glucan family phosphorylase [Gemmatimonadaceae bacterium]|nr:alpha-glucan family phosphorylase [Gemmatimonadaceae bacterium]